MQQTLATKHPIDAHRDGARDVLDYPRLIGLPEATVESVVTPHMVQCIIAPPDSATVVAKASALAQSVAGNRGEAGLEGIRDHSPASSGGSRVPKALARCATSAELLATLAPVLDLRVRWAGAALRVASGDRHRCVASAGDPSVSLNRALRLDLDGDVVGHLDLASEWETSHLLWSLSDVLPHVAFALARMHPDSVPGSAGRVGVARMATARWSLTDREREVLELVVNGKQNKDIASELGLSVKTVEKHVGNLLSKAGAQTRTEVVGLLVTRQPVPAPRPRPRSEWRR